MVAAPHSSINQPIGSTRNIAAVRFPLEEIKSISAALGGTVNDVLLCAATTGLRSLLLARDERLPVRGLRAMVPVNRRRDDELQDLGNRIAALSVSLPVAESGALERYRRIRRATAAAKSGGGASGSSALLELAALAPPVLHSAFVRSIDPTRLFNLTITNVPGPTLPLYAFGARLVDVVPVVPLAAGQTIGIAIVSYAGGITVGICCDRASVPDLDVVADGIFGALVELDALAHSRAA
jgi:WS/DGAT/MGAT family acyltransferase